MFYYFSKILKNSFEISNRFLFEKVKKIGQYFEQNTFIMKLCKGTTLHGFNHIANTKYTAFERFRFTSFSNLHMKNSNFNSFQNWMAGIGAVVRLLRTFYLYRSSMAVHWRSIRFNNGNQLQWLDIRYARLHNLHWLCEPYFYRPVLSTLRDWYYCNHLWLKIVSWLFPLYENNWLTECGKYPFDRRFWKNWAIQRPQRRRNIWYRTERMNRLVMYIIFKSLINW